MKRAHALAAAAIALLLAATPPVYRLLAGPSVTSSSAPLHFFVASGENSPQWLRCDFTNPLSQADMGRIWQRPLEPCSLGEGWTYPSPGGVVSMARKPQFEVFLPSSHWTVMLLTVKAFEGANVAEPQTITIRVNGQELETLEVPDSWTTLQLPIPAGVLREGTNQVTATFGQRVSPPDAKKRDSRLFAVHLRQIHFVRNEELPLSAAEVKRIVKRRPPAESIYAPRFESRDRRFVVARPGTLVLPVQVPADAESLHLAVEGRGEDLPGVALRIRSLSSDAAQGPISAAIDDGRARREVDLGLGLGTFAGDTCLIMVDVPPLPDGRTIRISEPKIERREADAAPTRNPGDSVDRPTALPDIVMITLDAARADRFSCYGHTRRTTPNIDRLAEEALIFQEVFALAPYTLCSVPTMVTGLSFLDHQITNHGHRLTTDATTLAENLKAAGYRTACFSASPNNSRTIGTDQGYDDFVETWKIVPRSQSTDPFLLSRLATDWLAKYDDPAPLHIQLHYVPPHAPYTPLPEYDRFTDPAYDGPADGSIEIMKAFDAQALLPTKRDIEHMLDLYDGNLLEGDAAVGLVLDALRGRDRWRDTVVLVTSDHGEAFLEHGRTDHNSTLYDEMLHVPFVLRLPAARRPADVDTAQLSSLADLTPTLLATAGLAPADRVSGRNLLRPGAEARSDSGRYLIGRTTGDQPLYSLRTSTWKLILSGSGQGGLYNLERDPAERQDLSLRVRPVFSGLGLLLTERLSQPPRFEALPELEELPEEDAEMLKALGYLQ